MELGVAAQYFAFAVLSFIAVAGALGMTTTMSMFRSAIFLMASFIGVGGLFILLMADLLGMLQVMMYIGGMLVMALFMVLFSGDPGGAMMTSMMSLPLPEKVFSLGLKREGMMDHGGGGHEDHDQHAEHENGHDGESEGSEEQDGHEHGDDGGGMDMEPMFIVQQKMPAAILATAVGLLLSALVLFRPAWPVKSEVPDQRSAELVGDLLMGKYMIAFEGAGLLIMLGIFGAVFVSRPWKHPDPTDRDEIQAAVAEKPAPVETEILEPLFETDAREQRE